MTTMALLNALFWWMVVFNFNKLFAFLQLDRQGQESREKGHGFLKFLATTALLTTLASKGKDAVMRGTGVRALQRRGVAASEAASARTHELAELRLRDQAAAIAEGAQAGELGAANATAGQAADAQEQLGSLDRQVADLDRTIANPQANDALVARADALQGHHDELLGLDRDAAAAERDTGRLEDEIAQDQARARQASDNASYYDGKATQRSGGAADQARDKNWEAEREEYRLVDDLEGNSIEIRTQALANRMNDLRDINARREILQNQLGPNNENLFSAQRDVEQSKQAALQRAVEQRDGVLTASGERQGGALAARNNLRDWLNSPQVKHDLDLARRGAGGTLDPSPQDIAQAERDLRRSPEWEKVQRQKARASVRNRHWEQKYGGRGR